MLKELISFVWYLLLKAKLVSKIGRMIDSTQVMLASPWLIRQLSDRFDGISSIDFYKNKALVRIKKHCLVYDWLTSMILHYFKLEDDYIQLVIQENILHINEFKYLLDQSTHEQFRNNTLFLDDQYICFVSNEESVNSEGLILIKTGTSKRFECKFGKDFKCD